MLHDEDLAGKPTKLRQFVNKELSKVISNNIV